MTTQFATASYQEIIDLKTETNKVSVIGIHTPCDRTPYDMLSGLFDTFQKYHYDGCSLSLVPAARLPADPSQVSYEGGEQPIDPRDLLNPILWHGCHGESLGSVLNQFYSAQNGSSDIGQLSSDSAELFNPSTSQIGNTAIFESLYYRALTDNTWLKAHPQRGFRKSGLRPLVYEVSSDRQYINSPEGPYTPYSKVNSGLPGEPGDDTGSGTAPSGTLGPAVSGTGTTINARPGQALQKTESDFAVLSYTKSDMQFFTSRLHGLGWLDTRNRLFFGGEIQETLDGTSATDSAALQNAYVTAEGRQKINYLPRLFMGICLLPPAYKSEQYFRLILNHRFSFKKFRGISMRGDFSGNIGPGTVPNYKNFD